MDARAETEYMAQFELIILRTERTYVPNVCTVQQQRFVGIYISQSSDKKYCTYCVCIHNYLANLGDTLDICIYALEMEINTEIASVMAELTELKQQLRTATLEESPSIRNSIAAKDILLAAFLNRLPTQGKKQSQTVIDSRGSRADNFDCV